MFSLFGQSGPVQTVLGTRQLIPGDEQDAAYRAIHQRLVKDRDSTVLTSRWINVRRLNSLF